VRTQINDLQTIARQAHLFSCNTQAVRYCLPIEGNQSDEQPKNKMNTTEITTAARRISRKHNARIRSGFTGNGKLVFGADGTGGAWYSDSSYGFGADHIVVSMRQRTMTAAEAQEMLDAANE
jgi:hypothetical protein